MRTTWQRLVERLGSGDPVIGADDIRGWSRLEFERAVGLGILHETDVATTVRCYNCDGGHSSEVVWVAGGRRALIACPQEGPRDVDPKRLRQWRFDGSRLAELLTEALEFACPAHPIQLGRLWHVGRQRLAGRFRDIFLLTGEVDDLSGDFESLLRYDGWTSGVLLVPRAGDSGTDAPSKLRIVNLASVSRLAGERLSINLDYSADCFADDAPAVAGRAQSITAPPGTSWKEAAIILHDAFMRVTIRGRTAERDYAQAGFRDPDQRLVLLKLFGAARGVLDAEKAASVLDGGSPLKTRISRLRRLLQELKGHEFPTQLFKSHYNMPTFEISKYASSEILAWAMSFALGNVAVSGTGPYVYVITPALDEMLVGCAVKGWKLSIKNSPGRASAMCSVECVTTGMYTSPSGITLPAATPHEFNAGMITALTFNGVNYLSGGAAKQFVSMDASWENNFRPGFFPGSGSQDGYQIQGRFEWGDRTFTVQFVVRVEAGSTEYASLIALTTGTATFTMTRDADNSFTMLIPKMGFNVVELGNTDGIATLQVTGVQLYDPTNGLVTMSVTTPQTGICQ
jgi:hypothetical protein